MSLDLAELTNQPTTLTLAGRAYKFSELYLEQLGQLQAWIKAHAPHPLHAVKPFLKEFGPEDRKSLLEGARKDALRWPPVVGSPEGAAVLLEPEEGQVEFLRVALSVHQPETTAEQAERLLRSITAKDVKRILAIAFRLDSPDEEAGDGEDADPKVPTPRTSSAF